MAAGVYSGSQCKFNPYCGRWSNEVCNTVFPSTGESTVTEIYLCNPLKVKGRPKKKKKSGKGEERCGVWGGGWSFSGKMGREQHN